MTFELTGMSKQTEPLWVKGSPEGRDDGPPGFVEVDAETGLWWRKTTEQGTRTGWEVFGSGGGGGGGSIRGTVAPEGLVPAALGTFYRRSDDSNYEFWYKEEGGSGVSGWYLILKLL